MFATALIGRAAEIAAPWQTLYADSTVVSASVTAIHIVALLLSGGLAVAADRATLRALRVGEPERTVLFRELHAVHRPVLVALCVLVLSGFMLAAADVETFAASPAFWLKMALVVALLCNGIAIVRVEQRIERWAPAGDEPGAVARPPWHRLARYARLSMALWIATTLAGTVLTAAA